MRNNNCRLSICITEKYLMYYVPIKTFPGNSSCTDTTKFGKKIFIIYDWYIKPVKRNQFNQSILISIDQVI